MSERTLLIKVNGLKDVEIQKKLLKSRLRTCRKKPRKKWKPEEQRRRQLVTGL